MLSNCSICFAAGICWLGFNPTGNCADQYATGRINAHDPGAFNSKFQKQQQGSVT